MVMGCEKLACSGRRSSAGHGLSIFTGLRIALKNGLEQANTGFEAQKARKQSFSGAF
jgi:hypothetical protein